MGPAPDSSGVRRCFGGKKDLKQNLDGGALKEPRWTWKPPVFLFKLALTAQAFLVCVCVIQAHIFLTRRARPAKLAELSETSELPVVLRSARILISKARFRTSRVFSPPLHSLFAGI